MIGSKPRVGLSKSYPEQNDDTTFINNSDYMASPSPEENVSNLSIIKESPHTNEDTGDYTDAEDDIEHQEEGLAEKTSKDPPVLADNSVDQEDFLPSDQGTPNKEESTENTDTHRSSTPKQGRLNSNAAVKVPNLAADPPVHSDVSSQLSHTTQSPTKHRDHDAGEKSQHGPRLVISKLVLTNFKSYAGVQEIGPFNASFSAVVGPNGSGKSNVIDSMLFVFGFRALKMRQGKLSELIHNSEGGQKLDYCQVDIHFMHVTDDDKRVNVAHKVPDSDIVISRRATKANVSQYLINGRNSNYTDVTTYLRGQGIDLDHKRFLILQGEVESIAQMKPKAEREHDDGLLEYLEDIIGTSKYKLLIDDSLVKVEELNLLCLEKENRFELVEKDTASLEEKKNEALKFLEMEKKLIDKRSIKYQVSIRENTSHLEENEKTASELNEKLNEEIEKNKELNSEVDKANEEKTSLQKALSLLKDKLSASHKKQKTINSQTVSLEEKLKNLGNKVKRIQRTKLASESSLASSTMQLDNLRVAEKQFKEELEQLEQSLESEKSELGELRKKLTEKTSHLTQEIEELQKSLEPFNDRLKAKEGAIEIVRSEMEMLEAQAKSTDSKLREASQRLVDIKKEGKAKESEIEALEKKLSSIDEQIALGEEQCRNSRKQLESRRVRLASARQKTQDAVNSMSNLQNKNRVLVSLMKLAKSGRIEGFHGRLGDLGQIDDKYDVAISTACPGLDSMVVETVETAQTCIEYLRKNKLGYASFICLNKLRKFNLGPIQTPGNPMSVKRLYDLIIPKDQRFLPAFYSKLYDTLVATNLQEAKTVAYGPKRFKVVTLDGKVVDTSGTMSGGGNNFARGGMKLTSNAVTQDSEYTEEEVEQMRTELQSMESKVQQLSEECEEMDQKLRKLKDMKPETEFAIQTIQLDIKALVAEKKEVADTCKALIAEKERASEHSEAKEAMNLKKSQLEELIQERDALKLQMIDSESKIAALEEKIMEAGGVELKVQNSKVDSIKQKIEIIHEKTSGDVMAIKKFENDIKRHTKIIADSEAESIGAEKDSSLIQDELGEKRRMIEELKLTAEVLQTDVNDHESKLEKNGEELEELNAKINELKSDEIELRNQLERLNSIIRRHKAEIAEAEETLGNLVIRDCSSYIDWLPEEERSKYSGAEIYQLNDEEIGKVRLDSVEEDIADIESYMNTVKVDIEVLKEYGRKLQELELRRKDLNESVEQRDSIKNHCEELKRRRLDEFMEGFNTISLSLKEMYQMITMGGNAELELVDSLDPFSEGILFSVMPPKKSWKNISNLSGGEKTLSSLALVFALHKYKPTPLYVMDEIDAALDFRNVSIVANYIKERTKNAQFVVISLRNNMFELAQQLVGIYKVDNRTRSISLQNKELIGGAK